MNFVGLWEEVQISAMCSTVSAEYVTSATFRWVVSVQMHLKFVVLSFLV